MSIPRAGAEEPLPENCSIPTCKTTTPTTLHRPVAHDWRMGGEKNGLGEEKRGDMLPPLRKWHRTNSNALSREGGGKLHEGCYEPLLIFQYRKAFDVPEKQPTQGLPLQ